MPGTSGSVPEPVQVPKAEMPTHSPALALQVGIAIVVALYLAREVLIPITLAVLLSFLLSPVVGWLRRIYLPRLAAVFLAVIAALATAAAVGGLIGSEVAGLAPDVPRYASTIQTKVETVQGYALGRLSSVMRNLGRQPEPTTDAKAPTSATNPSGDRPVGPDRPIPVEVHQPNPSPLELAQRVLSPVLSPVETIAIVFVFAIFILLQQEDLRDRLIRLFGSGDLHRTTVALDDAGRRLSRYFLTQLSVNAAFGCVIAAGLFFIGIPSPVLWGVMGGLLRFVPYVGAFLAAGLPLVLAAAIDPGWVMVAWTAALFVVVEGLTGQVLEPLLYGRSTGLSPFSVVMAATFWTWLWGPIGLILSTPLTLCLVVLGRHVRQFEFLDVILGDRPALTPAEAFYQRMLADDPDEVLDQAELLLKERSLSNYYDEVALKGLQLAANDVQRGVLNEGQLERIREAVKQLVTDLDHHDDQAPPQDAEQTDTLAPSLAERALPKHTPPSEAALADEELSPQWKTESAVLCLAGRGPLDEAASATLAQLLRKHGFGAEIVPYEAASRGNIGRLNVAATAMVCISYLEISGSPSHLRYLIRRIRDRLPGRPILVGLWPADDAVLKEQRVQNAIGADEYTTSLRAAVETCLRRSHAETDNVHPSANCLGDCVGRA